MLKISVKVESTVICVCGKELKQLYATNNDEKGIVITVSACSFCQEEARSQAYNKGLENGRKLKDD